MAGGAQLPEHLVEVIVGGTVGDVLVVGWFDGEKSGRVGSG